MTPLLLVLGVHTFPLGLGHRDRQRPPPGVPGPIPTQGALAVVPQLSCLCSRQMQQVTVGLSWRTWDAGLRPPASWGCCCQRPLDAGSGPHLRSLSDWKGPLTWSSAKALCISAKVVVNSPMKSCFPRESWSQTRHCGPRPLSFLPRGPS